MNQPSFWQRVRRARVVQVLAVYLGASWVVLQIAEVMGDALALPDWVMPVAVLLLLIGMVVIVSTAWVQSLPQTTERERAGEVPTDWEIAPKDAVSSVLRGRLPHLTWGRAIVGGVVVLALLFGGTGLYVGLTGGEVAFGPSEAEAVEAAEGIAVIPFDVRGSEELEIWREGMMDLLTNNLDGVGGFRTIDSRTVMAKWRQQVGDAGAPDLRTALIAARSTGARYGLEGSVVGLGDNVRLVANMYDLDTGDEVAQGQAEGPAADVLRLVDELAVGTMRSLLQSIGRAGAGDLSAETLTTTSLPALRAFLEGEASYRRGQFAEAVQSFERAVAEDTAFAIALVRLSEAYGWLEDATSDRMREYGEKAEAQAHRLSPRYQFIMEGWSALHRLSADGVESLEEAVQKYPDDPEAWFLLAETYIHVGPASYGTDEEALDAIRRAIELDPNFAPYRVHEAEYAVLNGDRPLAEEILSRYEALTGNRNGVEHIELAIPLLLGDSTEAAGALRTAGEGSERTVSLYGGTFARRHDRTDVDARMDSVMAEVTETNRDAFQAYYAGMMAEHGRGAAIAATVRPVDRGVYWGAASENWDVPPPAGDDPGGALTPDQCDDPQFNAFCHMYMAMASARWGRWDDHARHVARFREHAAEAREEDPEHADLAEARAEMLEGAGLWRRGNRSAGRRILERHIHRTDITGARARLEMGWLEADAGRPGQALRHFRTQLNGWTRPAALYGMARMHEELGQPERARRYYESLATIARNGDDLPRVAEIRQALAREGGD